MKDTWSALSDSTRRKILTLLQKQNLTAGEIVEKFELTNATISHHLKILREADLVYTQHKGQQIIYILNTTVFQGFLKEILTMFNQEGDL